MAQKQSILGRISQLTRANINALLDKAEDPQKMLDQLVRDYTSSIAEAEDAVAQTIGNLRLAEADHAEDVAAAKEWGGKALAASQRADVLRTSGQAGEADRFDQLAKVALTKQISFENEAKQAAPMIASQGETVEKLKVGLVQMRVKLDELKVKRDQLVARAKTAEAQAKVADAVKSIDVLDPTSELSRFEEKVRRDEALVAGRAELASSSLDSQFAELEADGDALEVEARLAELKALQSGTQQAVAGEGSAG
jgi:phage shock protein A